MGDKAYSSAGNRAYLRRRGIKAVIPVKEDQKSHRRARGSSGGRPPVFDPGHYKQRNTVERCFSKLKQFRAVATRYDKRERIYRARSTSHQSVSGYATPSHDLRDTP
jgi:transposase